MKTISKAELNERIKLHELWLEDNSQGERLVLIGYGLSDSDLSDSDLSDSDLSDSDLSGSDLRGSDLRFCTGNMAEIKSLHFDTWVVTYTDTILNIGCQSHRISDWFEFDDDTIEKMDTNALAWWRKYRDILKQIIEASTNED